MTGDIIASIALGFTVITWLLGLSYKIGQHAQKLKDLDDIVKDNTVRNAVVAQGEALAEIRTDIKHIMRFMERCPGFGMGNGDKAGGC